LPRRLARDVAWRGPRRRVLVRRGALWQPPGQARAAESFSHDRCPLSINTKSLEGEGAIRRDGSAAPIHLQLPADECTACTQGSYSARRGNFRCESCPPHASTNRSAVRAPPEPRRRRSSEFHIANLCSVRRGRACPSAWAGGALDRSFRRCLGAGSRSTSVSAAASRASRATSSARTRPAPAARAAGPVPLLLLLFRNTCSRRNAYVRGPYINRSEAKPAFNTKSGIWKSRRRILITMSIFSFRA
jgi:hypothetical protein